MATFQKTWKLSWTHKGRRQSAHYVSKEKALQARDSLTDGEDIKIEESIL